RYLRALAIKAARGQKLVPEIKKMEPVKTGNGRSAPPSAPTRLAASPSSST
ncbi:MAG: hypothetical protein JWP03_543, partial [Phycisphaerales bacterium]|nr:hypothetical protein [Phycisphaerales bacterium]